MIVENELLGVPKLKIYQDPDMFNFSLDSILLANFVQIRKNDKKILDMGCGNAPIPLYLTLKTSAKITGIEIQKDVFELAKKSVEANSLESQIDLINDDYKNLDKYFSDGYFDQIVVNPPFFKVKEGSNLNDSEYKTIARHEVFATLDDIINIASHKLKFRGILNMVHRPDRLDEIIVTLNKYGFTLKRLRFVYPKEGSICNHILIEAMNKGSFGGLKILNPLNIYDNFGNYTEETLKIYNGIVD